MNKINEINYEAIKHFYYVVNYKTIIRAAKELEVTQPTISASIKKLETALGLKLFVRNVNGITLNKNGQKFYEQIKHGNEFFQNAINEMSREIDTTLRIAGTSSIVLKHFINSKVASQLLKNSKVMYEFMSYYSYEEFLQGFMSETVDVLIVKDFNIAEVKDKRVEIKTIGTLHFKFCYNKNFFNLPESISLTELNKFPLIMKGDFLNTMVAFHKENSHKFNVILKPSYDEQILDFVNQGVGIGYLPVEYINQTIKTVEVLEMENLKVDIMAVYFKDNAKVKQIKELFKND